MFVAVWSPKGGCGASVVAAAIASVLARSDPVRILDCAGDQPAYFGLPDVERRGNDADPFVPVSVAPGIELVCVRPSDYVREFGLEDAESLVVDLGAGIDAGADELCDRADTVLMVVRGCYVALRRAVQHPLLRVTDGVVLVDEPGRALSASDVADVLALPVVATIPAHESIARAADAGVLAYRCPELLTRPLRRALRPRQAPRGRWGQ